MGFLMPHTAFFAVMMAPIFSSASVFETILADVLLLIKPLSIRVRLKNSVEKSFFRLTFRAFIRGKTMQLAYTIKEAAKQLGCGINTMYDMVNSGEIRSFRFGKKIMIPTNAVEEVIKQGTKERLQELGKEK